LSTKHWSAFEWHVALGDWGSLRYTEIKNALKRADAPSVIMIRRFDTGTLDRTFNLILVARNSALHLLSTVDAGAIR